MASARSLKSPSVCVHLFSILMHRKLLSDSGIPQYISVSLCRELEKVPALLLVIFVCLFAVVVLCVSSESYPWGFPELSVHPDLLLYQLWLCGPQIDWLELCPDTLSLFDFDILLVTLWPTCVWSGFIWCYLDPLFEDLNWKMQLVRQFV